MQHRKRHRQQKSCMRHEMAWLDIAVNTDWHMWPAPLIILAKVPNILIIVCFLLRRQILIKQRKKMPSLHLPQSQARQSEREAC